jgi:HlyD family secretion protein
MSSRRARTLLRARHTQVKAAGATLLIAAAVLSSGCKKGGDQAEKNTPAAQQASTPAAILVTTSAAAVGTISETLNVTGSLGALNDVTVGIKNAGKVIAVYAREGDHVHAGQVLAQQDTTDIDSQIRQARANLRSAETRLDQAKAAYAQAETSLRITDSTTASAVQQAQAGLKASQDSVTLIRRGARAQELAQAQKAVESAQADLDSARADAAQSAADLRRYTVLHDTRAISDQQLDQARTVKISADARVRSAAARLDSAKQALSLTKEGAQAEDIHRTQEAMNQANQALKTAESNRATVELRKADVTTAKVGIDAAQSAVDAARAQLAIAEQMLKDSIIRSPIDGVVAERKVEPGMQLASIKPDVMRIIGLNSLYFDGLLPQAHIGEVKVGMPVTVLVDSLTAKTLKGTITRVFPVASATARSFTIRVSVDNTEGLLRPQMFARGSITLGTHKNVVLVPREAVLNLQENGEKQTGTVFIVKDGKAAKKDVSIGYSNFISDEILSGVNTGDDVVTVGQGQIQDGDLVKTASTGGH